MESAINIMLSSDSDKHSLSCSSHIYVVNLKPNQPQPSCYTGSFLEWNYCQVFLFLQRVKWSNYATLASGMMSIGGGIVAIVGISLFPFTAGASSVLCLTGNCFNINNNNNNAFL